MLKTFVFFFFLASSDYFLTKNVKFFVVFFSSAVSSFLPYKVWSHTKESGELVHVYLKTLRDLREFLADQTFPLFQTSPFINEKQRGWLAKVTISEWKRWDSNQVLCLLFCLQWSSLQGSSSGNSQCSKGPRISYSTVVLSKVSHTPKKSIWEVHNLLEHLYFIWTLSLLWLIIPLCPYPSLLLPFSIIWLVFLLPFCHTISVIYSPFPHLLPNIQHLSRSFFYLNSP